MEWDAQRAAAGEKVWSPLSVQQIESWLLGRWELAVGVGLLRPVVPLDSPQTLELWRQVIRQQERQSGDYHLLRPAAAAELANQARDTLRRWQVDTHSSGIRQLFELDRDCKTFLQWLGAFERRLAHAGLCTPLDCLSQLSGLAGKLPAARVALVEFDDIAPLLRTALTAVGAEVRKVQYTRAAGQRLKHSFSDKRAELQAVASWVAGVHRAAPGTTIGIVLTDMRADRGPLEYLLRREFGCLGENYTALPVNFSVGIPLAQAPLARDALAVLATGLHSAKVPAVVNLMRSRYLDLPDAHSALAQKFVNQLFTDGVEELAIADVCSAANAISLQGHKGLRLGQHLLYISRMRDLRRNTVPSVWASQFGVLLSAWGWPGNQKLDSLEYQQLELWYHTLENFRSYDAVCGAIDFSAALALLRDLCSRQISQPQTVDSPIQVLGPLEAAGLAFDHLWLCGMQGATWPAAPSPNPFIPLRLQTQLRMPHANPAREQAFSEALLSQYIRCSQTLHASYCRQVAGVPDRPSTLLHDFVPQAIPELPIVAAQWTDRCIAGALEEVDDNNGPPLDPGQQSAITGGSSLLEHQSHCPFRAFTRHRLKVNALPGFSAAFPAADRGSLLHAALYALWGELGDSASLHEQEKEKELSIATAIQAALAALPGIKRRRLGAAYWRLEAQRLTLLLREWLAVECRRSAFSVVAREEDVELDLAGLRIRLRVDRIDQLPDGGRMIIDYKSGDSSVQDWLGERPARPQLLLYSTVGDEPAAALAFAQLQPRNCRYVGLGRIAAADGIATDIPRAVKSRVGAQDWLSLNEFWRNILQRLAQAFVAGEAQVDPLTSSSCRACGLQALCRIGIQTSTVEAPAQWPS